MTPKPITAEAVRNDAANVLAFLRALDAAIPGHVPEELLLFLDSARQCELTQALLAQALSGGSARVRASAV